MSIELITIVQALRHLNIEKLLSKKSQEILEDFEAIIPDILEDKPLYPIIEIVKQLIKK
jgi:histidine ammonia-lyase